MQFAGSPAAGGAGARSSPTAVPSVCSLSGLREPSRPLLRCAPRRKKFLQFVNVAEVARVDEARVFRCFDVTHLYPLPVFSFGKDFHDRAVSGAHSIALLEVVQVHSCVPLTPNYSRLRRGIPRGIVTSWGVVTLSTP